MLSRMACLCVAIVILSLGVGDEAKAPPVQTPPCPEEAPYGNPAKEKSSWTRPPEKPPNPSEYVIKLNQMHTFYDVPGEYGHALEGNEHGFSSLSFIITETHPGGGPPLHTHDTEEAHVLLQGSAIYVIGNKRFRAEGPYVVRVPAGTPHTFFNAGSGELRLIGILPAKKISYHELGPNPLLQQK